MKWLVWLCLLLTAPGWAQPLDVRVPRLPVNLLADEYQLPLLRLALEKSGVPYTLHLVDTNLTQDSITREMESGKLFNLYWMGTSSDLERRLHAIPIPLLRGLEGARVLLIHRDEQEKFNQINTLEALRQLHAGQGVGWGDNQVLEAAGITSYAGRFSNLFRLIDTHTAIDFFPRSLIEAFSEQHELAADYPNLVIDQHLLLRYPYAQFFFVSPRDKVLAEALQRGLQQAYADGSFLRFFQQNPRVREALAAAKLDSRLTLQLVNPDLTPAMQTIPAQYWEWPVQSGAH